MVRSSECPHGVELKDSRTGLFQGPFGWVPDLLRIESFRGTGIPSPAKEI